MKPNHDDRICFFDKDQRLALAASTLHTGRFVTLASSGAGKTYLGNVMAEELYQADLPFVAIDPMGNWWGLRLDADGVSQGCKVLVLGGDHGDRPLSPDAGAAVANVVVRTRRSIILDLSKMDEDEQLQFVEAFTGQLWRTNRHPLHVFIDEAELFCPERTSSKPQERCAKNVRSLAKRGRAHGLGCTLISQRPQTVAKDAVSQAEGVFAMQLFHPRDVNAVAEWASLNGANVKEIKQLLPKLRPHHVVFYSPRLGGGSPNFPHLVRARRTFDASATPESGDAPPPVLGPIDLSEVDRLLKTPDPEGAADADGLRAELARKDRLIWTLERDLAAAKERGERAVVSFERFAGDAFDAAASLRLMFDTAAANEAADRAVAPQEPPPAPRPPHSGADHPVHAPAAATPAKLFGTRVRPPPGPAAPPREPRASTNGAAKLDGGLVAGGPEMRVLDVLARYPDLTLTQAELGPLAGYKPGGRTLSRYLSTLRSLGLAEGDAGGRGGVRATKKGQTLNGGPSHGAFTRREVYERWIKMIGGPEKKILDAVLARKTGPDLWMAGREQVAQACIYDPHGRTFSRYLSTLRGFGMVETTRDTISIAPSYSSLGRSASTDP